MLVQIGLGGLGISLLYILLGLPDSVARLPFPPAVFYDDDVIDERNFAHFHIARLLQPRVVIRSGMYKVEFAAQVARAMGRRDIRVYDREDIRKINMAVKQSPQSLIFVRQKASPKVADLYPEAKIIEVTDDPQMFVVPGLHLHVAQIGEHFVYNIFAGSRPPVSQEDVNCPQASFILATMAADGVIRYLQGQPVSDTITIVPRSVSRVDGETRNPVVEKRGVLLGVSARQVGNS